MKQSDRFTIITKGFSSCLKGMQKAVVEANDWAKQMEEWSNIDWTKQEETEVQMCQNCKCMFACVDKYCRECGTKFEPENPIIRKSGETWVARYEDVDYILIYSNGKMKKEDVESCFKRYLEGDNTYFKPISEIEITDEIAKLRPMVMCDGEVETLFGVGNKMVYITNNDIFLSSTKEIRLATVSDLEEQS